MNDNEKGVFKLALAEWGEEAQIGMLHEEIGELLKAVNKARRKHTKENYAAVLEEIADVQIMLDQLTILTAPLAGGADVDAIRMKKIGRLMALLSLPESMFRDEADELNRRHA